MKFTDYLTLMRLGNCIIASFGVAVGYWLSVSSISLDYKLAFAMAAAFLICGGGNVANDISDAIIDRNKKNKPLANKKISVKEAKLFASALFIWGIVFSAIVNGYALLISIAITALLLAYSAKMQGLKFLGNFVVSAATSLTFIFGATISGNYPIAALAAIPAFFLTYSREVAKDLEDMAIDKGVKATLPFAAGIGSAIKISTASTIMATALLFLPSILGIIPGSEFLLMMVFSGSIALVAQVFVLKRDFSRGQGLMKYSMVAVIASYILTLV